MDLGFETIGNATLIVYDGGPLLATDPWIEGPAYFGSWGLSHEIPDAQRDAIRRCRYLWISHGHPDHLSPASLADLRDKEILLPDHEGGRIARWLAGEGYRVRVLEDGRWTPLSERVRVLSIGDVTQDAVLLADVGGRLVIDANDASDRGAGAFLRETAARYADTYLLCLTGYGDADMINFFDEAGNRVPPAAEVGAPLGPGIFGLLDYYGIRAFVPFSSMHRYERTDSAWANAFLTPLDAHARDFPGVGKEVLPPFVHCDFARDEVRGLAPPPAPPILRSPESCGDSWSDELAPEEVAKAAAYFRKTEHLRTFLGFVNLRVGGRDHVIEIAPEHRPRGITFETPRASLMTVVEHEVFDDLLIGNFTKTTLHGSWWGKQGTAALYPHFGPFLTKFGDNGGARTAEELRRYFEAYARRGFLGFLPTPNARELEEATARYRS